jgi:hypothetical protein
MIMSMQFNTEVLGFVACHQMGSTLRIQEQEAPCFETGGGNAFGSLQIIGPQYAS